jgi:tetratricopeptide (TPR) repeat protein
MWHRRQKIRFTPAALVAVMLGTAACATVPPEPSLQQSRSRALGNAAQTASSEGRFNEAEKLWKASVTEAERAPVDTRSLALGLMGLSTIYKQQARYAEAGALALRALSIWQTIDPMLDVKDEFKHKARHMAQEMEAYICAHLGFVYHVQGRFADAKPFYVRSLRIFERLRMLGEPHVIETQLNYASVLRATNRGSAASAIEDRVARLKSKVGSIVPEPPK